MAWTIEVSQTAQKTLRKLDKTTSNRITKEIIEIAASENPRNRGIAMAGSFVGHWRYRIGDHRVIAKLLDDRLLIYVVKVGHRREVYR